MVSTALALLAAMTFTLTLFEGVSSGLSGQLPGPMARHRDSMAIAISYVRYGHWDGYTSLRAVNRTLVENGMSLRPQDWANAGVKDYFELMRRPELVGKALARAASIPAPNAEGLFFMQDEKGMAPLYVVAFNLFGIAPESLFLSYMFLVAISLLLAFTTFWGRPWALFLFVAWTVVHHATAMILGAQTETDVNLIQGDRFAGVLALVPTMHLMLLTLARQRPTTSIAAMAILQGLLLMVLCNARVTTVWQVIALVALAAGMAVLHRLANRRLPEYSDNRPAFVAWPAAIAVAAAIGLIAFRANALHPKFAEIQQEHPIWHNVVTALHNNPERVRPPFNIPSGIPAWDDQISYILFERTISSRGESLSNYLRSDTDWYYRTSDPKWDFRWGKYDAVLREIFVSTIRSDPTYALQSLGWYQPITALRTLASREFLKFGPMTQAALLLAVALVLMRYFAPKKEWPRGLLAIPGMLIPFSIMPVMLAAVSQLRVVELFVTILLLASVLACRIVVAFQRVERANASPE